MTPTPEQCFLESYDPRRYDRPSVAVDVVVLTLMHTQLHALLTQRSEHPYKGWWALPGGFLRMDESLDAAAVRVLRQKAGLEGVYLEQLYTFGAVERDPRMRVLSVAYYALVAHARLPAPAEGATWLRLWVDWEGETGGPAQVCDADGRECALAFDHADILGMAVKRIRGKLAYAPISFELLPQTFTLRELQEVYETIWGRRVNKDSFRRKVLASGQLEATGLYEQGRDFRPAELYRRART